MSRPSARAPRPRTIRIAGGRILDPGRGIDRRGDLVVSDGRVAGIDLPPQRSEQVIDASACVVSPGFVDVHTHLREPGGESKETIATGTAAGAAGGFTTLCAMPNTVPVTDAPDRLLRFRARCEADAVVRVLPIAAVTAGQHGRELAPLLALAQQGAVAFSDDGRPLLDDRLVEQALRVAGDCGLPVAVHAEDTGRGSPGLDSRVATSVAETGIDAQAEVALVERHLRTLTRVGGRLHICHVTTAGAVEHIRDAKEAGLSVTAEATPHHLALTYAAVQRPRFGLPGDPYAKVNPPLRSEDDRTALVGALRDGTLDAVATDHAPHAVEEKAASLATAPSGLTGLEVALPLLLGLVRADELRLEDVVRGLTQGPADAFGLPFGSLHPGSVADVTVFAPDDVWRCGPAQLRSKGKNTPLIGEELRGRVRMTIARGRAVPSEDAAERV